MKAILLLIAFLSLQSAESATKKARPTITSLEQNVIEATIAQSVSTGGSKRYVIEDATSTGEDLLFHGSYDQFATLLREQAKERDPEYREALEDFIRKNATKAKLVFPRALPNGTSLVAHWRVHYIFSVESGESGTGWNTFYRRFPGVGGLLQVSRPGFDSKRKTAILYLGRHSHYLSGDGQLYLLKHDGKKWVLHDEFLGPSWNS